MRSSFFCAQAPKQIGSTSISIESSQIKKMRILFILLLLTSHLFAQSNENRVLIYPEYDQIIWDEDGQKKPIDSVTASVQFTDPKWKIGYAAFIKTHQEGNHIQISYTNGDAVYYLFSEDNGLTWKKEMVDHFENYDLQMYDYYTHEHQGPNDGKSYMGTMGGTHLAVDSKGNPHLTYTISGGAYNKDCYVIYATRKNGKWTTQKVLTEEGHPKRYLGSLSMALDTKDQPHIIAFSHERVNTEHHSFSLFKLEAKKWTRQVIRPESFSGNTMAIRIGTDGVLHVVATSGYDEVHYFRSKDKGKSWEESKIRKGNCRCNMELDKENIPHLACTCYNDGIYYHKMSSLSGRSRLIEKRPQMCHAGISFDPEGNPIISFFTNYNEAGDLKIYSADSKANWSVETAAKLDYRRGSSWVPTIIFVKKAIVNEADYEDRQLMVQHQIESYSKEVQLKLYDFSKEDQDSISLQFNGEWLVEKHQLSKRPLELSFRLNEKQSNSLILYALNEGLYPPNTAMLEIKIGNRIEKLPLTSDLKSSGGILIKYVGP
jgi:hypothetical protein